MFTPCNFSAPMAFIYPTLASKTCVFLPSAAGTFEGCSRDARMNRPITAQQLTLRAHWPRPRAPQEVAENGISGASVQNGVYFCNHRLLEFFKVKISNTTLAWEGVFKFGLNGVIFNRFYNFSRYNWFPIDVLLHAQNIFICESRLIVGDVRVSVIALLSESNRAVSMGFTLFRQKIMIVYWV
ncbi:hypothetical protein Y032_0095g2827 [Ancylostoma ceylanicum]|uniref:Uncharacterized protein n=1 Tax=Ancylostoma ceylanicum TaxID=53326 RepID=A0A016TKP1_9BILA|nr:hypothetical protein Y032_0095g2827 [Ancylostoma ceylanicum]